MTVSFAGIEDLRWDDLRVLLAVLREGSFTRAARSLAVEQSTVSRRIEALEASLGAPLFERQRAGPRPTELADVLRAHAERVEAEVHVLVDVARGHEREIRGRVRVALTEALAVQVVVPRLLGELRELHPHLHVDLLTSDLAVDLSRREADIALRFFRPTTGDLVTKRVASLELAVIGTASYLGKRKKRAWEELDWIAFNLPGIRSPEEDFYENVVRREPRMRTNSYLAQVEAVRAGLGVAILTRSLLRLDPNLRVFPVDVPHTGSIELWLVTPRTLRAIPRVDAVFRFFEARLPDLGT